MTGERTRSWSAPTGWSPTSTRTTRTRRRQPIATATSRSTPSTNTSPTCTRSPRRRPTSGRSNRTTRVTRSRRQTGGYGAGPTPANPTDRLRTFKLKGTYYYERKYGATLAYFQTTGSADEGLYGSDAAATPIPNSNGYIVELDWLPIQNVRLLLQYTGYDKFNGAEQLRRHRTQCERQQHVVLRRLGGVLRPA